MSMMAEDSDVTRKSQKASRQQSSKITNWQITDTVHKRPVCSLVGNAIGFLFENYKGSPLDSLCVWGKKNYTEFT